MYIQIFHICTGCTSKYFIFAQDVHPNISYLHRMYVQTYREQQQLQQENNQSPGPPAPPPDIQVRAKSSKEVIVDSGIEDHERSCCLLTCLAHGLVPLGSETGFPFGANCLASNQSGRSHPITYVVASISDSFPGSDIFHSICLLPFRQRQAGGLQGSKSQGGELSSGIRGCNLLRSSVPVNKAFTT